MSATDNPSKLAQQAWSHAEAGRWKEADVDSIKAVQFGATTGFIENEGFYLTWIRISFGNRAEYLKTCTVIQNRYGIAVKAHTAYVAAWLIVQRPDGVSNCYDHALRLAQHAVELEPKSPWHWETLSLAYLRNNNWQHAIEAAGKVRELSKTGLGTEFFVCAMACWQLGNKDKAHDWYQKGVQWLSQNRQRLLTSQSRWLDRCRFQMEAAALLGLPVPKEVPVWIK
jgi:tetratricopeptide (TPR) repeat protein